MPIAYDIVSLVLWLIICLYGVLLAYLFISLHVNINSNLYLFWTGFIIFFFATPIFIWVKFFRDIKYIKLGESRRAKRTTITYHSNDKDEAFNRSFDALVKMNADFPIRMDKPKLLRVPLNREIMTITIRRIREDLYKVDVRSDSQLVTTLFDGGSNRKNINKFKQQIFKRTE